MAVADSLYIMTRPMTFSSETLVTFMKSFKNLFPNPSYLIPQQHLNILRKTNTKQALSGINLE